MSRIDRQQRRLMRQRGTGVTDVDDVTFGFRFGSTPTSSRKQSSPQKIATPATQTENDAPSSRKSTASRARPPSAGYTAFETVTETPEVHNVSLATPFFGQSTTTAAGKRKHELIEDELASDIPSSTASKSRRLNSAVKQVTASPVNLAEDDELGDENMNLTQVGQISVARPALSIRSSRYTRSESANTEMLDTPSIVPRVQKARRAPSDTPEAITIGEDDTVLNVEGPAASIPHTASNLFVSDQPQPAEENDTTRETTETTEATMEDDLSITRTDEDTARRQMPPPPKPTKRKKGEARQQRKKYGGPMLEITVYRRTKDPANPDARPGNVLPSVNSADVLSQVVSELGNSNLEGLKTKQSRGTVQFQRVVRRRQATIRSFMARVDDCLFDLSNAQNSVYAISNKLQRAKREQGNLRAELMKLKRERDDINFKIDNVREKHVRRARENDEQNELLRQLHDLDIAIQRGRLKSAQNAGSEDEGEIVEDGNQLLEDVTRFISNGGFIGSVRRWNDFLQKSSDFLQSGIR